MGRASLLTAQLCLPPDITWYKGHEQLSAGAGLILSRDGKLLQIPRARGSDAGSYRCVASNGAGVAELWYSLQVTGECSCGSLRDGGSPLEYLSGVIPALRIHPWQMALADPCPLRHLQFQSFNSPEFIPNDVLESHGPMDGYCQVVIMGSPPTLSPLHPVCLVTFLSPLDSVVTPGLLPRKALDSFSHLIQASLLLPRPLSMSTAPGAEPGSGFSQGCSRPVGGSPAGRWPGSGEDPVLLLWACSCNLFPGKCLHVCRLGSGALFGFCCFCFSRVSGCWGFSSPN